MKKLLLYLIVLTHPFLVQASETQQSWFSKNMKLVAGISAAATGTLAGLALWQWNKLSAREAALKKAQKDLPGLLGEQTNLRLALGSNDTLLENHMTARGYKSPAIITALRADTTLTVNVESHLKEYEKTHDSLRAYCTPCRERFDRGASDYANRTEPCDLKAKAHAGFKNTVEKRKTVVDTDVRTADAAINRDSKTNFASLKWGTKAVGYTSSVVALASLGFLGYSMQAGK